MPKRDSGWRPPEDQPFSPNYSAADREFWLRWFSPELGMIKGRWIGYCPMHQSELEDVEDGPCEAHYDFWNGTWWCRGVENCLAPKKGGTIINLRKWIEEELYAAF